MKVRFARLFTAAAMGLIFGSSVFAEDARPQPGQLASPADAAMAPSGIVSAANYASVPSQARIATVEERRERVLTSFWIASLASMAAATSMDAATSYGKREGNSLLASSSGTFGAKAVAWKAGLSASAIASELVVHKSGRSKMFFTAMNFALTGVFAETAAHNQGIAAIK